MIVPSESVMGGGSLWTHTKRMILNEMVVEWTRATKDFSDFPFLVAVLALGGGEQKHPRARNRYLVDRRNSSQPPIQ